MLRVGIFHQLLEVFFILLKLISWFVLFLPSLQDLFNQKDSLSSLYIGVFFAFTEFFPLFFKLQNLFEANFHQIYLFWWPYVVFLLQNLIFCLALLPFLGISPKNPDHMGLKIRIKPFGLPLCPSQRIHKMT